MRDLQPDPITVCKPRVDLHSDQESKKPLLFSKGFLDDGAVDGARTRDPRRDRPVL